MLSRELAHKGHYPAIDVLQSISRVMPQITYPEQRDAANTLRELLATYKNAEDLINIGAYVEGSNPRIDLARRKIEAINLFLRQRADAPMPYGETLGLMLQHFPKN